MILKRTQVVHLFIAIVSSLKNLCCETKKNLLYYENDKGILESHNIPSVHALLHEQIASRKGWTYSSGFFFFHLACVLLWCYGGLELVINTAAKCPHGLDYSRSLWMFHVSGELTLLWLTSDSSVHFCPPRRTYCNTDEHPEHRYLSQIEAIKLYLRGNEPLLHCAQPKPLCQCLYGFSSRFPAQLYTFFSC